MEIGQVHGSNKGFSGNQPNEFLHPFAVECCRDGNAARWRGAC